MESLLFLNGKRKPNFGDTLRILKLYTSDSFVSSVSVSRLGLSGIPKEVFIVLHYGRSDATLTFVLQGTELPVSKQSLKTKTFRCLQSNNDLKYFLTGRTPDVYRVTAHTGDKQVAMTTSFFFPLAFHLRVWETLKLS